MITRQDFDEYWADKQARLKPAISREKVIELTEAAVSLVTTDPAWSVIQQEIDGWRKSADETVALMRSRLTDGPILSPEAYADTKTVLAYNQGTVDACKKILTLVQKH